jgi:predicted transcriptional regulator of viral defense system
MGNSVDELGFGAPPRQLVRELASRRVFREGELKNLLKGFQPEWVLAQHAAANILIDWMLQHTLLRSLSVRSQIYGFLTRYTWGEPKALDVAASLTSKAYFSHATAASLHGLLTYNPETIYLNREQSAKPSPSGSLTQEAIDRTFSKAQRLSQDTYQWGTTRATILSGKHSGHLGVRPYALRAHGNLSITGIERTLIDLVVRPDYAGGPAQVLEAFRRAQSRVSLERLLELLRQLDYRYPYHQAVGFYMQRAGYHEADLAQLEAMARTLNFYLGYGSLDRGFDQRWRVYFPRDL